MEYRTYLLLFRLHRNDRFSAGGDACAPGQDPAPLPPPRERGGGAGFAAVWRCVMMRIVPIRPQARRLRPQWCFFGTAWRPHLHCILHFLPRPLTPSPQAGRGSCYSWFHISLFQRTMGLPSDRMQYFNLSCNLYACINSFDTCAKIVLFLQMCK